VRRRTVVWVILVGLVVVLAMVLVPKPCARAWLRWGIVAETCPVGLPLPKASVSFDRVGRHSRVMARVHVDALCSAGLAYHGFEADARRFDLGFTLERAGLEPLELEASCRSIAGARACRITIPELPDGDYTVATRVVAPFGETVLRTELALYRDAVVHLATDRPLYRPGDVIRYRSVVLDAGDLAPLDGRPGTFEIRDPNDALLYTEPVTSGDFAVAAGRFPVPVGARKGTYTLRYVSGSAVDSVEVEVRPFSLPRLELELGSRERWYGPGEQPVLRGTVRYRTGTPVAGAEVKLWAEAARGWPPPTAWVDGATVTTDAEGAFAWPLGSVPRDLVGKTVVPFRAEVVDRSGDRLEGGTQLVLSDAPIVAAIQSELGDGLVADFPNRVFLHLTTPDGAPIPEVDIRVSRAWDPSDPGVAATTDVDAVAALTLDPGKPISVLRPARPTREPSRRELVLVERSELEDLLHVEVGIDERVLIDRWTPALEPCAAHLTLPAQRVYGVMVEADGRVGRVIPLMNRPVDRCVVRTLGGMRGPVGERRFYRIGFDLQPAPGAALEGSHQALSGATHGGWSQAAEHALLEARPCVMDRPLDANFPQRLQWSMERGEREVQLRWTRDPAVLAVWTEAEQACVRRAFEVVQLAEPSAEAAHGVTRIALIASPAAATSGSSGDTFVTAWELEVQARSGGEDLGSTRIVVEPGTIPELRLRAARSVLAPGDPVEIRLLRGPDFDGELPEDGAVLHLWQQDEAIAELRYDAERRMILGHVPEDARGLCGVTLLGATARLWVPDPTPLSVELTPDKSHYRPRELALLRVSTAEGGLPAAAGVSLMGVDAALGELAPLLSPEDWSRVVLSVVSDAAAFDRFDNVALFTGRVRGEHAVEATLQGASWSQLIADYEYLPSAHTSHEPSLTVQLNSNFYAALLDTRRSVARWERNAPEGERLEPEQVAALWREVLGERREAGAPVVDAFGLELTLDRLPEPLLEQLDPYALATDARRLSEDVQPWKAWVAQEVNP
jgi:hypothetical protein